MARDRTTETQTGLDVAAAWFRERLAGLASEPAREGLRAAAVETAPLSQGVMPPLYARDEDESYLLLEGEVEFHVGDERLRASAGDVVVAPRGVARTFRVLSQRARWLVVTSVRSLAGYEAFSRAVARPSAEGGEWPSVEEAAAVASVAAANGIDVLGPPGALPA
jgi:mannose-6-phosphate isomerase-like protein (cupin superfamily)